MGQKKPPGGGLGWNDADYEKGNEGGQKKAVQRDVWNKHFMLKVKCFMFEVKWSFKVMKAKAVAFMMRRIFSRNRLELDIIRKIDETYEISILDKDTMVYYQWNAAAPKQWVTNDKSKGARFKLVRAEKYAQPLFKGRYDTDGTGKNGSCC